MVELIAKPGAHIPYTTIRNWSNNVYNLVTKHAVAYEGATVEWVDGNLGSKLTIKYPAVYLLGRGARADILSVAFAGAGQTQNAGGKVIHVAKGAVHAKPCVRATRCCWTNKAAATATHPWDQVFYLQSHGLTEMAAKALIVNGFFDQFTKYRWSTRSSRTDSSRSSWRAQLGDACPRWRRLYHDPRAGVDDDRLKPCNVLAMLRPQRSCWI